MEFLFRIGFNLNTQNNILFFAHKLQTNTLNLLTFLKVFD